MEQLSGRELIWSFRTVAAAASCSYGSSRGHTLSLFLLLGLYLFFQKEKKKQKSILNSREGCGWGKHSYPTETNQ